MKQIAFRLSAYSGVQPKSWTTGVKLCRKLNDRGIATTIGKFSKDGDKPEEIAYEYCQCSRYMKAENIDKSFYLSLKPPALKFEASHFKRIADVALKNGHSIHFDSHGHHLAEPTLKILKHALNNFGAVDERVGGWQFGLTLPARWRRSLRDARWAVENGVRVRIVKGEFKADNPSEEMEPHNGFLRLVEVLSGSLPEIAIATHDTKLAEKAISLARRNGTKVELELLFGMPMPELIGLKRETFVPLRLYVPYGETLLLYIVQHLIKNPRKLMRPNLIEAFGAYQSKAYRICPHYGDNI